LTLHGAGDIAITTCSLDEPEAAPPQERSFASSRLSWLQRQDGLAACPRSRAEAQNE
jgi:hypothetical protein